MPINRRWSPRPTQIQTQTYSQRDFARKSRGAVIESSRFQYALQKKIRNSYSKPHLQKFGNYDEQKRGCESHVTKRIETKRWVQIKVSHRTSNNATMEGSWPIIYTSATRLCGLLVMTIMGIITKKTDTLAPMIFPSRREEKTAHVLSFVATPCSLTIVFCSQPVSSQPVSGVVPYGTK